MDFIVFATALFIGLSLGLFGSGGAILTLPSLIYFLGYDDKLAIISSLCIVGFIALIASAHNIVQKKISGSHLLYFAVPSLITSYFGGVVGSLSSSWLQLTIFVLLMVLAAIKILVASKAKPEQNIEQPIYRLSIAGGIVGFFTGFVGVGGGFLIVPALMFLTKMSLLRASATSLVIISIQSASGLVAYFQLSPQLFSQLNLEHIAAFSLMGGIGALFGGWVKQRINQQKLSNAFAYFLLIVACSIFVERVLF